MLTQSITLTYYVTYFSIWLKVVQNCSEDSFTSNKVSLNARASKKRRDNSFIFRVKCFSLAASTSLFVLPFSGRDKSLLVE
ncbi:hypothetical protein SAMD00079811_18110 [Scytonema sp. HK-05]|nr:hypothetical protein SAMD00079811_18110 [Scytonema sp. HK-05]